MKKLILAATGLLIVASAYHIPLWTNEVRPLTIQVLADETMEPVSNAVVYYRLQSAQNPHFLGIPTLQSTKYRSVYVERLTTDRNGFVSIPRRRPKLRARESLYRETIYINMDLNIEVDDPEEFFLATKSINPIEDLTGAYVLCGSHEGSLSDYLPGQRDIDEPFLYLKDDSLSLTEDEFVVQLFSQE
ncbi:MAG: hypothetical protein FH749_04615 [Firmicutes bacterium]|nr:hypothetical protein [Bacillota bacterium]